MAQIKAFRGLRYGPAAGDPATYTCPPYDIIGEEEREAYLRRNPYNVIRLELPREGDDPYAVAGERLREWCASGVLRRDDKPQLYIYEVEFTVGGEKRRLKGLICRVKLTPFSEGVILPHEFTLSKAKTDRLNLMKATGCNFSQIYSLYMDDGSTRPLIESLSASAPAVEFTDDAGVTHRLWAADDAVAIAALEAQFADRKIYIADGHHRYETALNYRDWAYEQGAAAPGGGADDVMMMLVDIDHPGLVVLPTHRVVRDLPAFDAASMLERCRAYFDIRELPDQDAVTAALRDLYDAGRKAFGFYAPGAGWKLLMLRDPAVMDEVLPGWGAASRGLDVSVLHALVLERVFGIDRENMANQKNLTYVKQAEDAVAMVDRGDGQCVFLLNPTRVTEIRDVAAAGEKMPQKSTYFYPKLITGLVMNQVSGGE